MPCDDGGRGWSDTSTNLDILRILGDHQKRKREG